IFYEILTHIMPDEREQISAAIVELIDHHTCHLVLTTKDTKPAPRDVTPETTLDVADKELPEFRERMRQISLNYVPTTILSRQVETIHGTSLIVNLPGQPKSIAEILDVLFASIPYCLELMGGPLVDTIPEVVVPFRPTKK